MAGGLIEVELDDDPLPPPRVRKARPPWSLRRWSWVAATLAVVLVVATGVIGADAARRSGRGGVPGFASDLAVPRHEFWHQDFVVAVAVTEDLVLVQTPGGDGIRAVRVADGTTAWAVESGNCSVVPLDGGIGWLAGVGAMHVSDPKDLRVGCTQYGPQDQGSVLYDMTGATVARIDSTDVQQMGSRLVEVRPDEGAVAGVTVRVWSAADGAPLWDRHYDGVDATAGVMVAGDALTFPAGEGFVSIDLATGESHAAASEDPQLTVDVGVPYGTVTSTAGPQGFHVTLVGTDGATRWSRNDAAYLPTETSAPGAEAVLLAAGTDGAIIALDAATGDELWSAPGLALQVLVHVPGIAVVAGEPGTVRDDRTGDVLWTVPSGEQLTATSDRELVLLRSAETNEFVVRDLRTGHEVQRYPGPDLPNVNPAELGYGGVLQGVTPSGGDMLVVGSPGGVAALG
ncbi:MAG: PQQ-binding-like beta-propeller repeat protein [Actinomycetales bacterium]|nr:PQQ-binding-like beta-propeller repeat protein [Actinomycetales bacterium]